MRGEQTCPFCQRIEAGKFQENYSGAVVRFEPLNPVAPGHMLFVPQSHVEHPAAVILGAAMSCAESYADRMGQDFNLITSSGHNATQTIPHLHVHYVPRRSGDGLALPWAKPLVTAPRVTPSVEDIYEVLREHQPTTGMSVASGVTCKCGYWNGNERAGVDRPIGLLGLGWHQSQKIAALSASQRTEAEIKAGVLRDLPVQWGARGSHGIRWESSESAARQSVKDFVAYDSKRQKAVQGKARLVMRYISDPIEMENPYLDPRTPTTNGDTE